MKDENNILELTPELLEFWNNSFSDEFIYPEKENKEHKKLNGKLFSRKNLFKDNYDSYLNTQFTGLWSDYIKSVVDDCEYL